MALRKPRKTATCGLPNISFFVCKPKPLRSLLAGSCVFFIFCAVNGQPCRSIKGDACFGSVICASELSIRNYEAILKVKQIQVFIPRPSFRSI
jgi:hypothetical protein